MALYLKSDISLTEAMTMKLPQLTRIWHVCGLHIQSNKIPPDAMVYKTVVMKQSTGNTYVGVEYTTADDDSVYTRWLFHSSQFDIKELEKEFPRLFRLLGDLYAFVYN